MKPVKYINISNSTDYYLNEIGKIPLLSEEEEKVLALKCLDGDVDAKQKLFESNLKLVVLVAKKYLKHNIPILDLIQEGNLGLYKAIDKYNPNLGNKFSTYAIWWINTAIQRKIRDNINKLKTPYNGLSIISKYDKSVEKLKKNLHRIPTNKEIAEDMNVSVYTVENIVIGKMPIISLNGLIDENPNLEFEGLFENYIKTPDEIYIEREMQTQVNDLLAKCQLSEKQLDILQLRFGLNGNEQMTIPDIAKKYHSSIKVINRIISSSLQMIRISKYAECLKIYIEDISSNDLQITKK